MLNKPLTDILALVSPTSKTPDASPDLRKANLLFWTLVAVSLVTLGKASPDGLTGSNLLWALACLAVGGVAGFLFGVPKVTQNKRPTGGKAEDAKEDDQTFERNNNLTEISDWLTKIIVGLTLVNLAKIPPLLRQLATIINNGTGAGSDFGLGLAIVLCFFSLGFLLGHVNTQLFLAPAFSRAAREARDAKAKAELVEAEISRTTRSFTQGAAESVEQREIHVAGEKTVVSAKEQALAAAKRAFEANSLPDAKKIPKKEEAASEIAHLVLSGGITKDWLVVEAPRQAALHHLQDGLIAGLAMAISVAPEPQDLQRLARVADLVNWHNARHKICLALAKLFSTGVAGKADVPQATAILTNFLRVGVDQPLREKIQGTAAVIARSTGITPDLPNL